MTNTNYPESVEERTRICMEVLKDAYEHTFDKYNFSRHEDFLHEAIGSIFFQEWLKGTDDEPIFDEERIYKLILTADVNAELEDMEKDGYIDLIEDGDGNEIVFLTEKGKLAANHLIDTTNTYNLIMN
jgi:hypothetical protein